LLFLYVLLFLLLFNIRFLLLLLSVLFVGGAVLVLINLQFGFDFVNLLKLVRVLKDLITKEGFVNHFVVWTGSTEVLVIHVRTLSRIDSNEVSSALVLGHSFPYVLTVLKSSSFLQSVHLVSVLVWVFGGKLIDLL
jgi:hypothetical protein